MSPRRSVHVPQGNGNKRFILSVLAVGVIVAVGAYMLAQSDQGAIDVSATITNANIERRAETGGESTGVEVVPEVFQNMPNGGLVPQGSSPQPAPTPEPTPSDTPTDSSTTTEGVAEDGNPTPSENSETTNVEGSEEVPSTESNGTE